MKLKTAVIGALIGVQLFSGIAFAQIQQQNLSPKQNLTDELYLKCEDKARLVSGYIGLIPKQYNAVNSMDSAFDNIRSQGLFDFRSSSFKTPYQSARVGGKVTFSFGTKDQKTRKNTDRKKRRDFRKSLNDCFLTNK